MIWTGFHIRSDIFSHDVLDRGETSLNVTVNAGTVTGPHNKVNNKNNQDAYASLQENGHTVIAVADGAGSLRLSDIGASIAASTSVAETMDALNDGIDTMGAVQKGLEAARHALLDRDDHEEIGCTIALAAISGDTWAVAVVGDAFAVVSYANNHHTLIRPDKIGEFANLTTLLTSRNNNYQPLYYSGDEPIVAISLSSDGLENVSITENAPSPGFWNPVVKRALEDDGMDVQAFLDYMDDKEKVVDDTTLVIAHR